MRNLTILQLLAWTALACTAAPAAEPEETAQPTPSNAEAIDAITAGLRSAQARARQTATEAAVEMGEAIVPTLVDMALDPADRGAATARTVLQRLGKKVRPALPRILELASGTSKDLPENAKAAQAVRVAALGLLQNMNWAVADVLPVLSKVAEDEAEDAVFRDAAVTSLGGMAKEGLPTLRKLAGGPDSKLREKARQTLAATLQEQGVQTRVEYYTGLIEADLFDAHVPEYLRIISPRSAVGAPSPLIDKVKTAYRARLKDKPDAALAQLLARVIQDQLNGTTLEWCAPSGRTTAMWFREDPAESHATLAEALTIGFEHAEKGSALARELGSALARLRLLQGDFADMNAVLERLEWDAPAAKDRPWLCAPPTKWGKNIAEEWGMADEETRSGDCGLVVRVEKGGHGLRGAHVVLRKAVDSTRPVASPFHADAALATPGSVQSLGRPAALMLANRLPNVTLPALMGTSRGYTFGYDGADRPATRYGVTDDQGLVKFEKLPEADVQIDVFVPTANFTEPGRCWDLWMEVESGKFKRAQTAIGLDNANPKEPPALLELAAGRTIEYPRLVVIPLFDLKLADWTEANIENFELTWPAAEAPSGEKVAYELEMMLSGPGYLPANSESIPMIRSTRQLIEDNHWPVGQRGVGGQRLSPGNIYAFRVLARDAKGEVLSRSFPRRVWTAWPQRKSATPYLGSDFNKQSPIRVETTNVRTALTSRAATLSERAERFLKDSPDAFEREYVQVGAAWLTWASGDEKGARKQLENLVESLPAGSVPQATARWLLDAMENGEDAPATLKLVAPRVVNAEE